MFNVVRRVIQIENTTIAIGNKINDNQPIPDNLIMAINPTRADFAVDSINSNTGNAAIRPKPVAVAAMRATIVCI